MNRRKLLAGTAVSSPIIVKAACLVKLDNAPLTKMPLEVEILRWTRGGEILLLAPSGVTIYPSGSIVLDPFKYGLFSYFVRSIKTTQGHRIWPPAS